MSRPVCRPGSTGDHDACRLLAIAWTDSGERATVPCQCDCDQSRQEVLW